MKFFIYFLVLQSYRWGRVSWLRYLYCLPNVMSLLSSIASSSRCSWLVYGVWHFAVMLAYFLKGEMMLEMYVTLYFF